MHFDIDASGIVLPREARACLEYRLFSVLSRFDADVSAVRVWLHDDAAAAEQPRIQCRVHVRLRPDGDAVVESSANWLYGAIDQGAAAAGAEVDQLVANGARGRQLSGCNVVASK